MMGEWEGREFEIIRFKWSVFFSNFSSASKIIFEELKIYLRQRRVNKLERKLARSRSPADDPGPETNVDIDTNEDMVEEDKPTTLAYGFSVLSILLTLTGNWIPSHLFTIRVGLKPSRKFVIYSYLVTMLGSFAAVASSLFFLRSLVDRLLHGSNKRTVNLMTALVIIAEVVWTFAGFFSLFLVIWKRAFFYNYVLYKANNIVLSKAFQRSIVIWIFVSTTAIQLLAEPLLAVLTVKEDFNQPTFFPSIEPLYFYALKALAMTYIGLGSICISGLQNIIPIILKCLLCAIGKHVELTLAKRLANLEKIDSKNGNKKTDYSKRVFGVQLSESDQHFLEDYSLYSIGNDWPQTDEPDNCHSRIDEHSRESDAILPFDCETKSPVSNFANYGQFQISRKLSPKKASSNQGSSLVGKQLFLFRNLAKDLSELKDVLHLHDNSFSTFHLLHICINGLTAAQWVVIGIVQSRQVLKNESYQNIWTILSGPLVFRTAISVVLFSISNIVTFRSCDRLPKQMQRLRLKLFKITLDLHRHHLESNRSHVRPGELELAWTLYDQVIKLSHEVNMRFVGNVTYGNNCLLLIFSREISVILIYIQIVDIFSSI